MDSLLTGIVTAAPPDTPETLELKHIKVQSHLEQAEQAAQRGELERAISLLEDAVMFDARHRTVLLLLAQHCQAQSKAILKQDEVRAYELMVKAGGYLRMLRDAHNDFSVEERKLIANVLFDGACAYARFNRQEDASASLSAAIDAGFDDLDRLKSEPDFKEFRKIPEMAKMLDAAAQRIQERAKAHPDATGKT